MRGGGNSCGNKSSVGERVRGRRLLLPLRQTRKLQRLIPFQNRAAATCENSSHYDLRILL